MKKQKKTSAFLVAALAVGMIVIYLFGFFLSQSVFMGREMYKDTPIPALPYIFLFDEKFQHQMAAERELRKLEAERAQETETAVPEVVVQEEMTEPESVESVEDTAEETAAVPVTYTLGSTDAGYFDDVLFVGDSRTDGLSLYSPLGGADYFSNRGVTVFSLFTVKDRDDGATLEEMLAEKEYGKIYIMLGINEIGYNLDTVVTQYGKVLEELKTLAPNTIIVIQANLSVSKEKSAATWYLTADRIHELNGRLADFADGERVFYLDVNDLFCDEDGFLKEEVSGDGVHPYAKEYASWSSWLCENAYVEEE